MIDPDVLAIHRQELRRGSVVVACLVALRDPGYGYGVENAPKDYVYPRGSLAMARTSDPNTNGGQFFIVFKKTELPDANGYSIFGRVTEGMDIVDRIAEQGIGGTLGPEAPKQPISILDVTVEKSS